MKTREIAMTWLAAGVLAAGLNAMYHDGGFEWAHRVADRAEHTARAAFALATGRADQFLAETQFVTARHETTSCRLATALARLQTRAARTETAFAPVEALAAREEAQLARMEANRARIEAQVARVRVMSMRFRSPDVCPRVRVNIPRIPVVKIPAPEIHISSSGAGPV